MEVEIIDCSNKDYIGFKGQLVNKEVYAKLTQPFCWQECMQSIAYNQIMIATQEKSFISDKNGFVTYKVCDSENIKNLNTDA